MSPPITGAELRRYMTENDLTLEDMGQLLGGKVATTIMRWQNGAEIPGDTQILLKLLIRGEMPFKEESTPRQVRDAMWQLEMSLETWEEINRRRIAGGFATVTDWIASLVREELHEQNRSESRTAEHGVVDEMALVSEGGDAVGGHLDAAASAFAKENPLPAGEAGGTAGTTGARKDVRYTRPPGRSGTGAGKR